MSVQPEDKTVGAPLRGRPSSYSSDAVIKPRRGAHGVAPRQGSYEHNYVETWCAVGSDAGRGFFAQAVVLDSGGEPVAMDSRSYDVPGGDGQRNDVSI